MGFYVRITIVLIYMVFWEIFLVLESYSCDDTAIDCFATNASESNLPITDCSLYENDNDSFIICYKFVFHFGTGLAAAGGMITSLKIITNVVSKSFLKLYSTVREKCSWCKCCCCCCYRGSNNEEEAHSKRKILLLMCFIWV